MSPAKRVKNTVNRCWRRNVNDLLTGYTKSLSQLLTDLLAIGGETQQQLKAQTDRTRINEEIADIWAAARLGFTGAQRVTLNPKTRAHRHVLQRAFRTGQEIRATYKAKFNGQAPDLPAVAPAVAAGSLQADHQPRDTRKR